MHYILYQITNKLNGKIYVGAHKTKNLDDGYMGSGKVIRSAIMKHGIENFTKVILETFENAEAMYAREAELVDETFLSREDVYNLRRGGHGGFEYINENRTPEEWSELGKLANKSSPGNKGVERTKTWRKNQSAALKGQQRFLGKTHSQTSKDAIGTKNSIKQMGNSNSQFGTIWVTDGVVNKKIKKDAEIPYGFTKGRATKN